MIPAMSEMTENLSLVESGQSSSFDPSSLSQPDSSVHSGNPDESFVEHDLLAKDLLTRSVALFYLKLEGIHNIPSSTVQNIFDEIKLASSQNKEYSQKSLSEVLSEHNVQSDVIPEIVEKVCGDSNFYLYQRQLSTDFLRKKFYREHFHFTELKQVPFLSTDSKETGQHFHYVPILETIKNMFHDPTVREEYEIPRVSQPGILNFFPSILEH